MGYTVEQQLFNSAKFCHYMSEGEKLKVTKSEGHNPIIFKMAAVKLMKSGTVGLSIH